MSRETFAVGKVGGDKAIKCGTCGRWLSWCDMMAAEAGATTYRGMCPDCEAEEEADEVKYNDPRQS